MDYPARHGGKTFIWAGPELNGDGVVQIVGKTLDENGRFRSVIEMGADHWGNGHLSLRRRLSGSYIASLGTNVVVTDPNDLDAWLYNGGQLELYSRSGKAYPLSASLFERTAAEAGK